MPPDLRPPRALAPVLLTASAALLALAWAMTQPPLAGAGVALDGALRRERVGDVALWGAAVALACALAWRPAAGSLSLAGVAVALTPAVVFLGGVGGDDGLAVAATIALAAGVVRIAAAPPARAPRWCWAATAGAVGLLALAGPRTDYALDGARDALGELPGALGAASGRFAGADVALPPLGIAVWAVALLALLLAADRVAGRAGRRALWTVAAVAVALAAVLFAAAPSGDGAALAARQPLALLAPLPLLAGELLVRAQARWWPRLGAGCFGLLALVQLLGFLAGAEGGDGGAWLAAALAGCGALAAAGALTPTAAHLPRR